MTNDHVNEEPQVEDVETSITTGETKEDQSPKQSPEEFLENFDWLSYQEAAEVVDEKKYKEFEKNPRFLQFSEQNWGDLLHLFVMIWLIAWLSVRTFWL